MTDPLKMEVRLIVFGEADQRMTLGAFLEANAEGIDAEERAQIIASMESNEFHKSGGGASGEWTLMATPLWQVEFPDFDPATMPSIPAGFDDVSWGADSCPSFMSAERGLIIFIDFANEADREHPGCDRFSVGVWDDGATGETLISSDDWAAIKAFIAEDAKSAPLPADLRKPVTDKASAVAWLDALIAAGLTFHLEDDPGGIVTTGKEGWTFRRADVPLIRRAVEGLYAQTWEEGCPIGYILDHEPAFKEG